MTTTASATATPDRGTPMTDQTTQTGAPMVSGRRARVVTIGLCVPAAMALAMSASTSYRFAGERLAITDMSERMALCGAAEAAIIALTLHSWGTRSKASAWLAYLFVAVQAMPAFAVSGGTGGIVRTVLGPVLLALMLHKLLGLEMRFSGSQSTGLLASVGREIRERLTARLGIGRRGADSAEIARSRAADRAVSLASRRRLGARAAVRLAVAIDAAQHGLGERDAAAAEASVVARVVRRKSVAGLHGIEARHVWATAAPTGAGQTEPADDHAPAAPAAPSTRLIEPVIYPPADRAALPFQTVPQPVPESFTPQVGPFQEPVNGLSADPIDAARELSRQGLSFQQIGDRLGRSKSWAYRAVTDTVTHANGNTF